MIVSEKCNIGEEEGLLRNVCQRDAHFLILACFDSSKYYAYVKPILEQLHKAGSVTKICSDDPRGYQACNSALLIFVDFKNISIPFCGIQYTDESFGEFKATFIENVVIVAQKNQCDGYCEDSECLDEASCNGHQYGMFCDDTKSPMAYVNTGRICDGFLACQNGRDEMGCSMIDLYAGGNDSFNITLPVVEAIDYANETANLKLYIDVKKTKRCITGGQNKMLYSRLSNFTRCSALRIYYPAFFEFSEVHSHLHMSVPSTEQMKQLKNSQYYVPFCKFYIDQTNCSDPMRGVVPCMIDGYPSTVSVVATCVQAPGLCDDGFDSLCLTTTISCRVHKHRFCDGILDCSDESDETSLICESMTLYTCDRRYHHETTLSIPISWLLDGFEDCLDGVDETEIWPTCGVDSLTRYVPENSKCEDVYICSPKSHNFVTFLDLCNGHDICGHSKVCSHTKSSEHVFTNPIAIGRAEQLEFLVHCVVGVSKSLGFHIAPCVKEDFIPVSIFGLNGIPSIVLPKTVVDCRNVFGRVYMYLSCSGKCKDQTLCPLRSLNFDSCKIENQYNDRVLTINMDNKNHMTFLNKNKKSGKYQHDIFRCNNDKCLGYEKVCNLADDCGDSSDEDHCSNNFACTSPKRFIALNQKCDGQIDCADYTDECNEDCRRTIIPNVPLKVFSWVIGCAAVILNLVKLFKNFKYLAARKFTSALINKVMTTVIHVGNLITGSYLLTIAILDSLVYAKSYCKERINWLSSDGCAFLGVSSTFGGQISLFSMTVLSIFRAMGIIKVQKITSKYTALKMASLIMIIAIASFCLAFIPLMVSFEDIFVNGMTYNPKITIFQTFVTKVTHINKINKYFGRLVSSEVSTWAKVNRLVDSMFSNQYGGIGRRKIHFYGDNGVCLFKYFVSRDDPQKVYVWSNLVMNLSCFIVIFVCYIKVLFFSKQRARSCLSRAQNRLSRDKEETKHHIAIIIVTDFICWVPFMMVCVLHFFETMDATAFYPISSIVILPINCVINPILYHNYITVAIKSILNKGRFWASLFCMYHSGRFVLYIEKLFTRMRNNVSGDVADNPISALNAGEPLGQNDESRPTYKTVANVLCKDDDIVEFPTVLGTAKNRMTMCNDTRRVQRKVFERNVVTVHRMRTIPEECETSQNKNLNPKNSSVFKIEPDKEKSSLSLASKGPETCDQNEITREECIIAINEMEIIGEEAMQVSCKESTAEQTVKFYQKEFFGKARTSGGKRSFWQKTFLPWKRNETEIHAHFSGSGVSRESRVSTESNPC